MAATLRAALAEANHPASARTATTAAQVTSIAGGPDADTFAINDPSHGPDTILDFTPGSDMLQISGRKFGGGLTAGKPVTLVFARKAAHAFHPGTTGYFIFDSNSTVWWDATGGSGADAVPIFRLVNGSSLSASNFRVI